MKKINLLILFLLSINILLIAQSVNHNQALANLIKTKKWFDIERYYQQHKDSINNEFIRLWYTAETSSVFNRPNEAINAYQDLISKNLAKMNISTLVGLFGQPMLQLYAEKQEYSKGDSICQNLINLVKTDTTINKETLQIYIQGLNGWSNFFEKSKSVASIPKIIDSNPNSLGTVQLIPDKTWNGIYFNAKWNNIPLRTIFDTGASFCYISNRTIANKIGVKFNTSDTIPVNDGTIKGLLGMVDSLTFGKFTIKNVPVFVSIEKINTNNKQQAVCDSVASSLFDIVLGMNIIRQLHTIEFDFEKNIMSFPKTQQPNYSRNIYIKENVLFMNMKICNTDFLTFFDIGGHNGLSINTEFYENHKQQIQVKAECTEKEGFVGNCNAASLYKRYHHECPNIDIQINDKKLTLLNDCNVAKDKENDDKNGTPEGGFLGNNIFKYCKKAIFDFDNMIFSIKN